MTIHARILNRKLANHIQKHIKKSINEDQTIFPLNVKWFNIQKSIRVIYYINIMKGKMIISCIWQKLTPFHEKIQ